MHFINVSKIKLLYYSVISVLLLIHSNERKNANLFEISSKF